MATQKTPGKPAAQQENVKTAALALHTVSHNKEQMTSNHAVKISDGQNSLRCKILYPGRQLLPGRKHPKHPQLRI